MGPFLKAPQEGEEFRLAVTGVFTEEAFREAARYLVEGLLGVYETRSEEAVFGRRLWWMWTC
jgi:hypothetical protein